MQWKTYVVMSLQSPVLRIRGLLQNAIWFIWKDNLGGFQHHDLLPLDMEKEQLLQDTPPLNTAICFECR